MSDPCAARWHYRTGKGATPAGPSLLPLPLHAPTVSLTGGVTLRTLESAARAGAECEAIREGGSAPGGRGRWAGACWQGTGRQVHVFMFYKHVHVIQHRMRAGTSAHPGRRISKAGAARHPAAAGGTEARQLSWRPAAGQQGGGCAGLQRRVRDWRGCQAQPLSRRQHQAHANPRCLTAQRLRLQPRPHHLPAEEQLNAGHAPQRLGQVRGLAFVHGSPARGGGSRRLGACLRACGPLLRSTATCAAGALGLRAARLPHLILTSFVSKSMSPSSPSTRLCSPKYSVSPATTAASSSA